MTTLLVTGSKAHLVNIEKPHESLTPVKLSIKKLDRQSLKPKGDCINFSDLATARRFSGE